jgi:hypothetical protein
MLALTDEFFFLQPLSGYRKGVTGAGLQEGVAGRGVTGSKRGCRKGLQEGVTGRGLQEQGCRKGLQEEGCGSRVTGRGCRKRGYRKQKGLQEGVA